VVRARAAGSIRRRFGAGIVCRHVRGKGLFIVIIIILTQNCFSVVLTI